MKAVLEFDLPADEHEFACAAVAGMVASALRDIDNALRNQLKHGEPKSDRDVMNECRRMALAVLERLE